MNMEVNARTKMTTHLNVLAKMVTMVKLVPKEVTLLFTQNTMDQRIYKFRCELNGMIIKMN